jgi:anion-transporting  ArsA/GET3 family ATPase
MSRLLDKRFIIVAGKGGVGRTVVSLVLGELAAKHQKRTLVCLCNAPSRYLDLIGHGVLDEGIRRITSHLDVVNLDPRASQEEYSAMILRNRTIHRLIFGSRIVRVFLDAVPGLAEWAMLGKATFHATRRIDGRPEYDLVVFDSPATGHGLDVLALPRAIMSAVQGGRMREEAQLRIALMEDPQKCEVVPVTIPEEMPINEAVEIVPALKNLGLSVERVVVNMVAPRTVSPELIELVARVDKDGDLPSWLVPAAFAIGHQRAQDENLEKLKSALNLPRISLPMMPAGTFGEASVHALVDAFEAGLAQ